LTDRIAAAFASHGRRAALMPYLMGGFPDLETSRAVGEACIEAGADLLELGVPFSDPLSDGPVIHAAATQALAAGATLDGVLSVCETLSARVPVVLMVYTNSVLSRGAEAFVERAAAAGAAGLIVPDLPHDEATALRGVCDEHGLALIALVAPNTPQDRLAAIGADARGFVYTVSLTGTTGERSALSPELSATVERVRAAASVPVAVGFGISTGEQARTVAGIADGVIVGSRVVRAAGEGGPEAVRAAVAELAAALV
jgi:tryptophan synthase alpha chain